MPKVLKLASVIAAAGVAALVLAPGRPAFAADQQLVGKKLLIVNKSTPGKSTLVILSKDPTIVKTAAGGLGDPILHGGKVRVITSGTDTTFAVPGGGATDGVWFTNNAGDLWKYKKGDGTAGDACKVVIVKNAKLAKAVCKGPAVDAIAINTSAPNATVEAQISTGNEKYCAHFNTVNGCTLKKNGSFNGPNTVAKYLSKDCTLDTGLCSSPSGAFLEVDELF
jgi:hypothetical protein